VKSTYRDLSAFWGACRDREAPKPPGIPRARAPRSNYTESKRKAMRAKPDRPVAPSYKAPSFTVPCPTKYASCGAARARLISPFCRQGGMRKARAAPVLKSRTSGANLLYTRRRDRVTSLLKSFVRPEYRQVPKSCHDPFALLSLPHTPNDTRCEVAQSPATVGEPIRLNEDLIASMPRPRAVGPPPLRHAGEPSSRDGDQGVTIKSVASSRRPEGLRHYEQYLCIGECSRT